MLKTLNQALEILNLFTQEHSRWTSKEISQKLEIPVINVYRILETFVANEYLLKDKDSKQYEIGPALTILSYLAFQKYNVYTMIHPYLEELMKETGEAVYLIKSEANYAINVDAVIPENKVSFAVSLNKKIPLYSGASYWSILAFLPQKIIDETLSSPFTNLLKPKKLTPEKLQKELEKVRKTGWSVSYEITTPDVVSISAPIFSNKKIVGALTVAKPIFRTKKEQVSVLGQLVKTTANQVSVTLDKNNIQLNSYTFFKERGKASL
ncbi:IclR family transcriptional regulator [Liquorilactobacillus mali]|uniref:IclR family transcriptional regulator n=1 Tax=Liquorilactobacillus mali TaxID=1618 RepID=UPI00070491E4|nr:IclR family transcriptional regulator [Liquorilactobacillus mali]MDN7145543.1 IclR family transcriptional regulator [Liquorilactobacillus mali]